MTIIIPEEPGTPDAREIDYQRINTKIFIDSDPVDILLTHHIRSRSDEGGFTTTPAVAASSQIFRLIPQQDVMSSVQTPDGVTLTPTYVLLGEWNCDMRQWDTFEVNGVKFVIVSPIRPDSSLEEYWYERKGDVARR